MRFLFSSLQMFDKGIKIVWCYNILLGDKCANHLENNTTWIDKMPGTKMIKISTVLL